MFWVMTEMNIVCVYVQCSVSDCRVPDSNLVRWMFASSSTWPSSPRPTLPSLTSDARRFAWNVRRWIFYFRFIIKLECGPMPNLMAALPNIGGALCSTPQSLDDAHYCRVPCITLPRRETRWNLLGCPKLANRSQPLVVQIHHIVRTYGGDITV